MFVKRGNEIAAQKKQKEEQEAREKAEAEKIKANEPPK